jgi:hypothetical protein
MYNKSQSAIIFIILSSLLFAFYFLLIRQFKKRLIKIKQVVLLALITSGILIFSYPAFSYDIFNYIFNAKMVVEFGKNPHIHSVIEFTDPMLGFMRNVHTPAPYFYGWTAISLLPYILGLGRIFTEIISFKLFSAVFLFLGYLVLSKIYSIYKIKDDKLRLTLFLLNPLILIETIGMGHNDLSMMVPALTAFYYLIKFRDKKDIKNFLFFISYFLFSVFTKYATIVLLPLFLIWYFKPKFDIGTWGAVLLFLIQFTRPIDQLHSWYLIWPLLWVLLSKKIRTVKLLYILSFFALFRYLPYIYHGHWNPPAPMQRLIIYFAPLILIFPYMLYNLLNEKRT